MVHLPVDQLLAAYGRPSQPILRRPSQWVFGAKMTCLAGEAETGGAYEFFEHLVPPGGGPPFHCHQHESEGFYVAQGQFHFQLGDKPYGGSAGQFFVFPKGVPHLYRNLDKDWGRLFGIVTPAGQEKYFNEIGQLSREAPSDLDAVFEISARHGITILTPRSITGE